MRHLRTLILASLLFSLVAIRPVLCLPNPYFVMYGSVTCDKCMKVKGDLIESFGNQSLEFYETMGSEEYTSKVLDISKTVFPGGGAITPLLGVFLNDSLVAIVAGLQQREFWSQLLGSVRTGSVSLAYEDSVLEEITDEEEILRLATLFGVTGDSEGSTSPEKSAISLGTVITVLSAAAADSINPCTFSIFAVLLILSISAGGRKRALRVGISFILAVFAIYYLIGFALASVVPRLVWIRPFLGVAAVILGLIQVISSLGGAHWSSMPKALRRFASSKVEQAAREASLLGSFAIGVALSFTLLPCSSGPYFVAVAFLSGLGGAAKALMLLLYNSVFVLPLFLILVAIEVFGMKARTLKYWRGTKLPTLGLVTGAILTGLGVYLILTSI